jgi:hypothetical protein
MKSWDKVKNSYKNGLLLKNSIFKSFDNSLGLKYFKKQLKIKKSEVIKFLLQPLYRLDIILWKLGVYSSVRKVQRKIREKQVSLNNKKVTKIFFLKKGDVIHILDKTVLFKNVFFKKTFFFSFCEIDFYSNTLIILKHPDGFHTRELSTIFPEPLDLKPFAFYLSKK